MVSIIIPVYNGSNFLDQAIQSALNQTYRNIEILVINDGSSDDGLTEKIARSYGNRLRYLFKENGGVATALNLGVQNSNGEYVSWLSHDDLYCENKIECQIAFLNSVSSEKVIVYSDWDAVDATNRHLKTMKLEHPKITEPAQAFIWQMFQSSIHGCSLLIPQRCFGEVGYFDADLKTTQDYDLWFKFLNKGYEFRHVPNVLIHSRWHRDQGTNSLSRLHHGEVEDLYVRAFDMFSERMERFPPEIMMEIVLSLRDRSLRRSSSYILQKIKLQDYDFYNEMVKYYVRPSITSHIQPVVSKFKQLAKIIWKLISNSD